MPAASAGARSTTTRTPISAAATASAITASPTCSANSSPPGDSTNRSAILRTKSFSNPRFHWARGDESIGFTKGIVCSNCEHLKFYVADKLVAEADPNKQEFAHLRYAPFVAELGKAVQHWGDLRIDGYIGGKVVISKTLSGKGVDQKFALLPDDTKLNADGADTTRVVLRVTDEFGAIRPFANDAIKFELDGPAELIGDNPIRPNRWHGRNLDPRERAARQSHADCHTPGFGQAAGCL